MPRNRKGRENIYKQTFFPLEWENKVKNAFIHKNLILRWKTNFPFIFYREKLKFFFQKLAFYFLPRNEEVFFISLK